MVVEPSQFKEGGGMEATCIAMQLNKGREGRGADGEQYTLRGTAALQLLRRSR